MAQDPHINPQGIWDDNWFANQGKTGGSSVDSILNTAIGSLSSYFPKQVKPYEQVNPFSFDEALAREASTAEYAPYYQRLLSDYTSDVERKKSRSQEDLSTTLTQLQSGKDYYMGAERRALDLSMKQTNEGYAGKGLFFSGARQSDINDINTQYGAETGNYMNQYAYNTGQAQLGAKRTGEDLTTAQSMYARDTGEAQKAAIEQGVLQRKSEAIQQYEMGRSKYYQTAGLPGVG